MRIISHRGYWLDASEKNKKIAFERSIQAGFGIETDLRDCMGEIVVSHDMPNGSEMTFNDFLELYISYNSEVTLALNIKSDGLVTKIKEMLSEKKIINYFVFDMSVPDMTSYCSQNLNVFSRLSELEKSVFDLPNIRGIWLDSFDSIWFDENQIAGLLSLGYQVAIVSPELHSRDHNECWKLLESFSSHDDLMLCTDIPLDAAKFFRNEND